jgi:hypothetical protein
LTKYRKSATKSEKPDSRSAEEKKQNSGYNPETWTEQFFREKREAEERAAKAVQKDGLAEETDGQKNLRGIPDKKGIPGM